MQKQPNLVVVANILTNILNTFKGIISEEEGLHFIAAKSAFCCSNFNKVGGFASSVTFTFKLALLLNNIL